MKKGLAIFLQVLTVALGIGIFVLMLWEPHLEGRNVHATVFEIYFKDPFLAYAYAGSIPFFVALYQAFKVIRYAGQNKLYSAATIKALQTIKQSVLITAGAIVGADVYLFIFMRGKDDSAGAVALGIIAIFILIVIAIGASIFARFLQNAANNKTGAALKV